MKIISRKTHGYLDYIVGLLLIASPWIFDFADDPNARMVPVILGITTLIYSLLTNYELGAYKKITFKTHLLLDTASGIFLAASPWLLDFNEYVYMPHLVLGILELGAVAMTEATDVRERRVSGRTANA